MKAEKFEVAVVYRFLVGGHHAAIVEYQFVHAYSEVVPMHAAGYAVLIVRYWPVVERVEPAGLVGPVVPAVVPAE